MATEEGPKHSPISAVALGLGLISLPAAFLPFGFIIALLALIFGMVARHDATTHGRPVRMAHGALVLGIVAVVISAAILLGFSLLAGAND